MMFDVCFACYCLVGCGVCVWLRVDSVVFIYFFCFVYIGLCACVSRVRFVCGFVCLVFGLI